jgi:hypothetical protein
MPKKKLNCQPDASIFRLNGPKAPVTRRVPWTVLDAAQKSRPEAQRAGDGTKI